MGKGRSLVLAWVIGQAAQSCPQQLRDDQITCGPKFVLRILKGIFNVCVISQTPSTLEFKACVGAHLSHVRPQPLLDCPAASAPLEDYGADDRHLIIRP
jgi:hypothetical protein